MGLKLFDDDSGDDNEKLNKIEINKEFARRYEHNKKREDLQRLEELKKKGVISEDDDSGSDESSEEEEEDFTSKKKDLKFFDALIKVRNKDPSLKIKEAKLFESESESDEAEGRDDDRDTAMDELKVKKEKMKPMYLKDVVSKHLIEEGPEFEDSEDDKDSNGNHRVGKNKVKSYSEEQEELRRAFLQAVEEAEEGERDGGELLKEKSKTDGVKEGDEDDDFGIGDRLDEYFGSDEKLDSDSMFLKDYFKNRLWMGEGGDKAGGGAELGFSEDEEEIEKQEDYEREYNFRFEENAGDRVMGHSRVVEGSVRKKTNARKLQRERKEERMAQAEFERKEELKHLKNLKKKEMREKLEKIKETAGIGDDGTWLLDEDDLEEEFDPEKYDKKMKAAFDKDYYEAEDIDPEFGSDKEEGGEELEKPDFDKEDEFLGLPKGWEEVDKSNDGFISARERILKLKAENEVDDEQIRETEDEDGKRKKKRKRRPSEVEKAVRDQLLEEYYKLDYEDTVGDLKTRFKYKTIKPKRYGLTTEEILALGDKELNQYVPLKKLAPYRENEWKVPRIKTYQQKQKNKELVQEEASSNVPKTHKKFKGSDAESKQPHTVELNVDKNNLSRKSKRKLRKAELKISNSRLLAYGKIPTKPKNRKNS
ncbi:hypothetical protein M9H77_33009 [Catharanthus roseus]|uniref:Uncharacterized protein n=1 Tax=Catharanthus roseus TaxID=4058 RepID=A0ACC0A5S9_CATRO|nr:hypothetical protein M9H77_33009 [Catharanthus roseus]